ncbi:hypothetical protein HELRODRAFT_192530 [Helobdella robusta]|uniref:Uncharacterized protein n=1 Tax=Helobdella robusta TaxID=6412 RepID=T1FU20_HELRO|nr:hypothetical protein HELRODRAFT_192530 [Helobdella robusta]ESO00568.1 hypothetical protein HELRODRAFT_192530 [Helobdella robusta]
MRRKMANQLSVSSIIVFIFMAMTNFNNVVQCLVDPIFSANLTSTYCNQSVDIPTTINPSFHPNVTNSTTLCLANRANTIAVRSFNNADLSPTNFTGMIIEVKKDVNDAAIYGDFYDHPDYFLNVKCNGVNKTIYVMSSVKTSSFQLTFIPNELALNTVGLNIYFTGYDEKNNTMANFPIPLRLCNPPTTTAPTTTAATTTTTKTTTTTTTSSSSVSNSSGLNVFNLKIFLSGFCLLFVKCRLTF